MELSLPIVLPPRARVHWRTALTAVAVAALLVGGWMWVRDSSLVAVRQVRISGLRGPQSAQIEALLRNAARRMTTLDFDSRALRAAVGEFPVVERVQVSTSFPHTVAIRAIERSPVATLLAGGQRTALASDGTALGPQLVSSSLPVLDGSFAPIPGQRVSDPNLLAAVIVLGAAPSQLAQSVQRVYSGSEGLTVAMRNGLLVYFGDPTRPHAKWASLARVLSDPGSAGARYVDVRVPERPASGSSIANPATPSPTLGSSPEAALAERLAQGAGGGAATSAPPAEGLTGERPTGEGTSSGEAASSTGPAGSGSSSTEAGGGSGGEGTRGAGVRESPSSSASSRAEEASPAATGGASTSPSG